MGFQENRQQNKKKKIKPAIKERNTPWNVAKAGEGTKDIQKAMDMGWRGGSLNKKEKPTATEYLTESKKLQEISKANPEPVPIGMRQPETFVHMPEEAVNWTPQEKQDFIIAEEIKKSEAEAIAQIEPQMRQDANIAAEQKRVQAVLNEEAGLAEPVSLEDTKAIISGQEQSTAEPIQKQGMSFAADKYGQPIIMNTTKEQSLAMQESGLAPQPKMLENGDLHIPSNAITAEFYKQVDSGDISQETFEQIKKSSFEFPITPEEAEAFTPYVNAQGGTEFASFVITKAMQEEINRKSLESGLKSAATVVGATAGVIALGVAATVASPVLIGIGVAGAIIGVVTAVVSYYNKKHFTTQAVVVSEAKGTKAQMRQRVMGIKEGMMRSINDANAGRITRAEAEQIIADNGAAMVAGIAELKRMENEEEAKYWTEPHPYREKLVRYYETTFVSESAMLLAAVDNSDPTKIMDILPTTAYDVLGEDV